MVKFVNILGCKQPDLFSKFKQKDGSQVPGSEVRYLALKNAIMSRATARESNSLHHDVEPLPLLPGKPHVTVPLDKKKRSHVPVFSVTWVCLIGKPPSPGCKESQEISFQFSTW